MRYLIYSTSEKLGDTVLQCSLMDCITRNDANAHITYITTSKLYNLIKIDTRINSTIKLKRKNWFVHVWIALTNFRPDYLVFMDNHTSGRVKLFDLLIRPRNRLIAKPQSQRHIRFRFQHIVNEMFGNKTYLRNERQSAPANWVALGADPLSSLPDGYIVLNPQSSGKTGTLNDDNFSYILQLLKDLSLPIIVLGKSDDKITNISIIDTIKAAKSENVFFIEDLKDWEGIQLIFRLVKNSRFLISVDTALVHIASLLNTPVLSLIKTEHSQTWFPTSENSDILITAYNDINTFSRSDLKKKLQTILSLTRKI